MNAHQVKALQHLTSKVADRNQHRYDGNMAFTVTECAGGNVLVLASNSESDMPWYGIHEYLIAFIGPRGGVRKAEGSINL